MNSMDFILEPVSAPDIEPITITEMKAHLRVTNSADDSVITSLITVARQWAEDFMGRALIDQEWRLTIGSDLSGELVSGRSRQFCDMSQLRSWNHGEILLRRAPVIEIISIRSLDVAGTSTAADLADYGLRDKDSRWPRLVAVSGLLPTTGRMSIVFRAGYANRVDSPVQDGSAVPEKIKQGIKLYCEALYDRDKDMMPVLMQAAKDLLKTERCDLQMA